MCRPTLNSPQNLENIPDAWALGNRSGGNKKEHLPAGSQWWPGPLGEGRMDAGVEGGRHPGVPAERPLPETRLDAVEGTYLLVFPTCDTSTPLLLLETISPPEHTWSA